MIVLSWNQVRAAQEEVLSKLPSKTAEFLRRRGAARAAEAATAASVTQDVVPQKKHEKIPDPVKQSKASGQSSAATAAAAAVAAPCRDRSQAGCLRGSLAEQPPPPTQDPKQTAVLPVARLRFSVDGRPLSLASTVEAAESVVRRDPLRSTSPTSAQPLPSDST